MKARDELRVLARALRHHLEVQRELGVDGFMAAPAHEREAFDAHSKALEAKRIAAITEHLTGKTPSAEAKAPSRQDAPVAESPAPSNSSAKTRAPTLLQSSSDAALEGSPAPDGAGHSAAGSPWRTIGSRPTPLFQAQQAEPALRRKPPEAQEVGRPAELSPRPAGVPPSPESVTLPTPSTPDPQRSRAEDASTAMLFPGMEPLAVRAQPLSGFDASEEEARKLSEMDAEQKLRFLRQCMGDCTRCKLHRGRNQLVFGDGSPTARLVFIGEGPGYHEDQQGIPFVGKAGQLLTKMIHAMGLSREEVYIANVVKCRPPNNRDPEGDEIAACTPFLFKQLETIDPGAIITLGRFASQCLLDTNRPMRALRGQWQQWRDVPVMPTYHPAYLLRQPQDKRKAWSDLQSVMGRLGLEGAS